MHQISVVVWNILDTNTNQVTTFVSNFRRSGCKWIHWCWFRAKVQMFLKLTAAKPNGWCQHLRIFVSNNNLITNTVIVRCIGASSNISLYIHLKYMYPLYTNVLLFFWAEFKLRDKMHMSSKKHHNQTSISGSRFIHRFGFFVKFFKKD